MRYASLFLIAFLASQPAVAKMYKWVDEHGVTHYGDTVPPQYAGQGKSELSNRGLVTKRTDAALTAEEIRAREEQAARKKVDDQKAAEQKRKDKALRDTYTSEKELDLARERNLQAVDLVIQSIQLRSKAMQSRLDGYRKQAAGLTKAKRPVPADLAEDIDATERELQRFQDMIKQKNEEKEAIRAKFDADKTRYRELTQAENALQSGR